MLGKGNLAGHAPVRVLVSPGEIGRLPERVDPCRARSSLGCSCCVCSTTSHHCMLAVCLYHSYHIKYSSLSSTSNILFNHSSLRVLLCATCHLHATGNLLLSSLRNTLGKAAQQVRLHNACRCLLLELTVMFGDAVGKIGGEGEGEVTCE